MKLRGTLRGGTKGKGLSWGGGRGGGGGGGGGVGGGGESSGRELLGFRLFLRREILKKLLHKGPFLAGESTYRKKLGRIGNFSFKGSLGGGASLTFRDTWGGI